MRTFLFSILIWNAAFSVFENTSLDLAHETAVFSGEQRSHFSYYGPASSDLADSSSENEETSDSEACCRLNTYVFDLAKKSFRFFALLSEEGIFVQPNLRPPRAVV